MIVLKGDNTTLAVSVDSVKYGAFCATVMIYRQASGSHIRVVKVYFEWVDGNAFSATVMTGRRISGFQLTELRVRHWSRSTLSMISVAVLVWGHRSTGLIYHLRSSSSEMLWW